jgi:hypothetical protein
MCLPKKIVYDIHAAPAESHIGCRVKDNTCSDASAQPFGQTERQALPGPAKLNLRLAAS